MTCSTCTHLITEKYPGALFPTLLHRCALMPVGVYHALPGVECRFEPAKWKAK